MNAERLGEAFAVVGDDVVEEFEPVESLYTLVERCAELLNEEDLHLGQALADVASLALVANQASADQTTVNLQLQNALHSRVALEQAKGFLAYLGDLDMDQAFDALRRYARDHGHKLTDVAARTVSRELPAETVLAHARSKGLLAPPPI